MVKESSATFDIVDHILLQEDGDLLTIHHAPDKGEGSIANTVAPLQEKDKTHSNLETKIEKMLQQNEKEIILTNSASKSPSIQTILSKVGGRIGGASPPTETLTTAAGGCNTDDKSPISHIRITSTEYWL